MMKEREESPEGGKVIYGEWRDWEEEEVCLKEERRAQEGYLSRGWADEESEGGVMGGKRNR